MKEGMSVGEDAKDIFSCGRCWTVSKLRRVSSARRNCILVCCSANASIYVTGTLYSQEGTHADKALK